MDFYHSMMSKNQQYDVEKGKPAVQEPEHTSTVYDDKSNFLNYQFDMKSGCRDSKPIPPEQKPAPKKLKDAISKRVDSAATRYMNMVNS